MDNKDILQTLIDLHEENESIKHEYWEKSLEAMMKLPLDEFKALRKVVSAQGENIIIEAVFAMLTSYEDAEAIFGR